MQKKHTTIKSKSPASAPTSGIDYPTTNNKSNYLLTTKAKCSRSENEVESGRKVGKGEQVGCKTQLFQKKKNYLLPPQ